MSNYQILNEELIYNEWKINLSFNENEIKIKMNKLNLFEYYEEVFTFNYLKNLIFFFSNISIKEILNEIIEIIKNKNLIIKEIKEEKKLILTLKSNIDNILKNDFILKKNIKINNTLIEYLYEKVEYLLSENEKLQSTITILQHENTELKNEINSKRKILEKIKDLEKRVFEKFENLENKNSKKNKLIFHNIKTINAHNDWVTTVSVFPSGKIISVSKDKTIKIWDENFNIIQIIENQHSNKIDYISIKNENNFITCSFDKSINIYRKEKNKFILRKKISNAHNDEIRKVIYCDNGNIFSCSFDRTIKYWEEVSNNNFQIISILNHSNTIWSILKVDFKNLFISSGLDGTKFWNLNNFECINYIKDVKCYCWNAISLLDENRLIIGGGNDNILKIISLINLEVIYKINNEFKCWGILNIIDKNVFLIGGISLNIKIYNSIDYKLMYNIEKCHNDSINGITLLNNGLVATYSDDCSIKVWEVNL